MVEFAELLFPAFGLVMLLGGGALVRKGRFYSRQSERVAETDVTDIGSLARGTVAVQGTARVDEDEGTVTTGITGEEALVSRSKVTSRDDYTGDDGSGRRLLHEEEQAVPFFVEDRTGTVRVHPPEQADLRLDENVATRHGSNEEPDMADLAEDPDGVSSGELSFADDVPMQHKHDSRLRYEQAAIVPGEDVYVLGEAVDRADWDGADFEITGGENPERFVVSDEGRDAVQSGGKIGAYLAYAIGGFFGVLGLLMLLGGLSILV